MQLRCSICGHGQARSLADGFRLTRCSGCSERGEVSYLTLSPVPRVNPLRDKVGAQPSADREGSR
jgi:hypothetical protein